MERLQDIMRLTSAPVFTTLGQEEAVTFLVIPDFRLLLLHPDRMPCKTSTVGLYFSR